MLQVGMNASLNRKRRERGLTASFGSEKARRLPFNAGPSELSPNVGLFAQDWVPGCPIRGQGLRARSE
jgi:hypothetical protein